MSWRAPEALLSLLLPLSFSTWFFCVRLVLHQHSSHLTDVFFLTKTKFELSKYTTAALPTNMNITNIVSVIFFYCSECWVLINVVLWLLFLQCFHERSKVMSNPLYKQSSSNLQCKYSHFCLVNMSNTHYALFFYDAGVSLSTRHQCSETLWFFEVISRPRALWDSSRLMWRHRGKYIH